MPHRHLSDAGSNSGNAQHRAEVVPQGVIVQGEDSVVTLWDAGHLQVTVENLTERLQDVELRCSDENFGRDSIVAKGEYICRASCEIRQSPFPVPRMH